MSCKGSASSPTMGRSRRRSQVFDDDDDEDHRRFDEDGTVIRDDDDDLENEPNNEPNQPNTKQSDEWEHTHDRDKAKHTWKCNFCLKQFCGSITRVRYAYYLSIKKRNRLSALPFIAGSTWLEVPICSAP